MSNVKEVFEKAAEEVRKLKVKPSDIELLELYSLFKQGTIGDNDTAKPSFFDLKGKAKWDAWNSKKGITMEQAQNEYIILVQKLISIYGLA